MRRATILGLVRHGETPANTDGIWHGSTDSPLTLRGSEQAQRVAGYVQRRWRDVSAIYSSDLQRARLTAEPIGTALGIPLTLRPGLREYDLGSWEGKTYADLVEVYALWDHIRSDPEFAPHGGESPRAVVERFTGALRDIAAAHPGERVVVVAHGGALSMALGALLDGDYTQWRRVMGNGALSELVLDPEPALLSFDRRDHLEGLGEIVDPLG